MKHILAIALLTLAACAPAITSPIAPTPQRVAPAGHRWRAADDIRFIPESRLYQGYPMYSPVIRLRGLVKFAEVDFKNELVASPIDVWFDCRHGGSPDTQVYPQTNVVLSFAPTNCISIMQAFAQPDPGAGVLILMPPPAPPRRFPGEHS